MMVEKVSEKRRNKKANRRHEENLFIFLSKGLISYDKGS